MVKKAGDEGGADVCNGWISRVDPVDLHARPCALIQISFSCF
jgi:hypothetical protein